MVIYTRNVFLIDLPRRPMGRQVVFETVFIATTYSMLEFPGPICDLGSV